MLVTTRATAVQADRLVFWLPDPHERLRAVTLWSEVPVGDRTFVRVHDGWQLDVPIPGAHRVEYLYTLHHEHGSDMITDPTNPRSVDGVFGPHSWLPMPGYTEPAWLEAPRLPGHVTAAHFDTTDGLVTGELWAPADVWPGTPLPLLICHDGTQMARYGRLIEYLEASLASHRAPLLRVLLLDPGADRNGRYAANPNYSNALVGDILPAIDAQACCVGKPVLMGQSLGALAALHAARRHPGTFAGLFLQSGSFFTAQFDPQERGYSHWADVTGFTSTLYTNAAPERIPTTFVCGTQEENLANNIALATQLANTGGEVSWGEVPDGHTWTTWRDLLDPHLTRLLTEAWR